jgi:hypothetical protein
MAMTHRAAYRARIARRRERLAAQREAAERAAWDKRGLRAEALDRLRDESRRSWSPPGEAAPSLYPPSSSSEPAARSSSTLISQGGRSAPPGAMPLTPAGRFAKALRDARGRGRWRRLDLM